MTDPVQSLALPTSLDALAISVGAVSGALHARRRRLDVMGILVVAMVGALGGGVIRDIVLVSGPPVFLTSPTFLAFALVGTIAAFGFTKLVGRATLLVEVIDGLFIGVWVLVAATKSLANGLGLSAAVLVAMISAIGGGILRDLFCGERVAVLQPGNWLALSALGGALTFTGIFWIWGNLVVAEFLGILCASGLRIIMGTVKVPTPMPIDLGKVLSSSARST